MGAVTPIRAGVVTTWNTRCGIAEYSRYLLGATRDPGISWTILAAEERTTVRSDEPQVVRCWRSWVGDDLTRLLEEVDRLDLDLVHFQYEANLLPIEALASAVAALKRRGRQVWITFHSTAHKTLNEVRADLVRADRIMVHSRIDVERLASDGIIENVVQITHGIFESLDVGRERVRQELGLSSGPVVATCGFMMPHKGMLQLIEAVSI
jgi:O-antigen biosynthesis alpha-1,2-mannosyltransferase